MPRPRHSRPIVPALLLALAFVAPIGCGAADDEPVVLSEEEFIEARKERAESLKGEAGPPPRTAKVARSRPVRSLE